MLDLTKEQAIALLCRSSVCASCLLAPCKVDRNFVLRHIWDARHKLKAYIQSDISDTEEETLP